MDLSGAVGPSTGGKKTSKFKRLGGKEGRAVGRVQNEQASFTGEKRKDIMDTDVDVVQDVTSEKTKRVRGGDNEWVEEDQLKVTMPGSPKHREQQRKSSAGTV